MMDNLLYTQYGFEIYKNKIWFVPFSVNMLCGYSLDNCKIDFKELLLDESVERALSYNTVELDGRLLSIPARGTNLYALNESFQLSQYSVGESSTKEKYAPTCKINSSIIIFPIEALDILIIQGDEISRIQWNQGVVLSCTACKNKAYFTNGTSNIYSITESGCISNIRITNMDKICGVQFWKELTIAVSSDGGVYLIDLNKGKCMRQLLIANKGDYFISSVIHNDKLYLFPNNDYTTIYIYDFFADSVAHLSISKDENINEKWLYNSFGVPKVYDSKIYVMSPKHNALLVIDNDNVEKKIISLEVSYEEKTKLMKSKLKKKYIVSENDIFSLDVFIDILNKE